MAKDKKRKCVPATEYRVYVVSEDGLLKRPMIDGYMPAPRFEDQTNLDAVKQALVDSDWYGEVVILPICLRWE